MILYTVDSKRSMVSQRYTRALENCILIKGNYNFKAILDGLQKTIKAVTNYQVRMISQN